MPSGGKRVQLTAFSSSSAAIERPGNQGVLEIGDADDRAQSGGDRDAHQILQRLQIERAMLGVEEYPIETRRCQRPNRIRRTKLKTAAAELHPAFPQRLLDRVDAHRGMIQAMLNAEC